MSPEGEPRVAYYRTLIRFTGTARPDDATLARLNRALKSLEGMDHPRITRDGIDATQNGWRNPSLDLEQMMALLERAGFPCEGKQARSQYLEWWEMADRPFERSGPARIEAWRLALWDEALNDPPDMDLLVTINDRPATT